MSRRGSPWFRRRCHSVEKIRSTRLSTSTENDAQRTVAPCRAANRVTTARNCSSAARIASSSSALAVRDLTAFPLRETPLGRRRGLRRPGCSSAQPTHPAQPFQQRCRCGEGAHQEAIRREHTSRRAVGRRHPSRLWSSGAENGFQLGGLQGITNPGEAAVLLHLAGAFHERG